MRQISMPEDIGLDGFNHNKSPPLNLHPNRASMDIRYGKKSNNAGDVG
jgi:hypothetical protein